MRLSRLARKNDWRRAADAVTQASGLSDARGETAKMTALAAAGRQVLLLVAGGGGPWL